MAISSVLNTRGLAALVYPGVKKWYDGTFNDQDAYPDIYDQCFNVMDSTRATENVGGIVPFGLFNTKSQGAPITYDGIDLGFMSQWNHRTFGKGFRVTEEMAADDQYGQIQKLSGTLAAAAKYTYEYSAANVFGLGFGAGTAGSFYTSSFSSTTQTNLMADGVSLFGTHTIKGPAASTTAGYALPSTFNNSATNPLTETNLGAGISQLAQTPNERGVLTSMWTPDILMVHPNLMLTASQILNSTATLFGVQNGVTAGATANSGVKSLVAGYTGRLKLIVNPYLGDTTAWFLLCKPSRTQLIYFWRQKVGKPVGQDDFDTGDAKFKVTYRMSVGAADFRGTYGSLPA